MIRNFISVFALCILGFGRNVHALEFEEGDHICIVGGGVADRMQHSGYLEALIHAAHPNHKLAFRNLAFAGDELTVRMRSEGFGSPDEWLTKAETDVVLAFFGYNESFRGAEGIAAFRKDLADFVERTLEQKYTGEGPPRLALFTPAAAEKHTDPNFPDPAPLNANLRLYAKAVADVAREAGVEVVDLFSASEAAYARAKEPLTINGVHLKDEGYAALAPAMFEGLTGKAAPSVEYPVFEKLRAAVNEKNATWFSRYRTMDGYNVYGGRSHLEFDGITNRVTMQREMEIRDTMTANRDRRVWAVAAGGDLAIDDSNAPPPIVVETNKPGDLPDKRHTFLGGEAAIGRMKVPPGVQVGLFASEEQFPELANPVQMAFDTKGRLWVAAWPSYPERTPESKTGDSLLIFEDTNNDGKADRVIPFLDDLNCPTGFQFYKDGVIVVQAPDVWFARDTDGDDHADSIERLLNGLDSADSHHTANALALDPGGAIYLSDGVFHRTQVETPWGPPARNRDAAILRFEPRTSKFEVYVSYGFANPHGRVFDRWGNDLITDATGNNTYFGPAFSGRIDYPEKHSGLRQFWERPSRPCPGTAILSSRHWPEEFRDNFLNINVIGFQGIYRVKVREEGSGLWGDTIEPPMVESSDPNFRPTAAGVAPDGSLYFVDWHNPIIGHMQHHIRDPNRDHTHGRIYRMTYEGRELLLTTEIVGAPIEDLVNMLQSPEDDVRTRAKIELGARDAGAVLEAVEKWAKRFDAARIEDQHHLTEALWVHQWLNVVNERLLLQMLRSPEPRARAQAVRVLGYWRDRIESPLNLLRVAANDDSPRVRLEAVRVASFFSGAEAMDIAHEVLKYDTDYYLDYTLKETVRQLEKSVEGIFLPKDPKALARAIGRLSDGELARAPNDDAVLLERAIRPGLNINTRTESLATLGERRKSDLATEAIAALRWLDTADRPDSAADDLGFLLASLPRADLAPKRQAFAVMAMDSHREPIRRAGFAGLVAASGNAQEAWAAASEYPTALATLLDSIALQSDLTLRGNLVGFVLVPLANPPDDRVRAAAIRALPLLGPEHAANLLPILSDSIVNGRDRAIAARALMQMPRESITPEFAAPVAQSILDWAKTVPAADRTNLDYVDTVQAGLELAALLPSPEAERMRKELRGLGVRVIVLRSVREQMRYDISEIVVEAGKPVEIVFENVDMMPHNVVVVEPGAREEIGKAADQMSPEPDGQGRSFVPNDKRILAASKMVEPGMKTTLKFDAPKTPGDYDYVCTYPEHWMKMFGKLRVIGSD